MKLALAAVILSLATPFAAAAQTHEGHEACAAMNQAVPAGWTDRLALTAAAADGAAGAAVLRLGQSAAARLKPAAEVTYPVALKRAAAEPAYGGLFELNIPTAGTYRLSLSEPAWVEVAEAGVLVVSSAHAHGPACSTLRKMVDFPLKAGRHVVEIAGSPNPEMVLMAAPAP